jgi:hypothetical protein
MADAALRLIAVDLDSLLVRLLQLRLGIDLHLRRLEARHHGGGVMDQPLDAHERLLE